MLLILRREVVVLPKPRVDLTASAGVGGAAGASLNSAVQALTIHVEDIWGRFIYQIRCYHVFE